MIDPSGTINPAALNTTGITRPLLSLPTSNPLAPGLLRRVGGSAHAAGWITIARRIAVSEIALELTLRT